MSGDHDHAPGLPPVHDEAADTPLWVPLLGLGVLILGALYLVIHSAFGEAEEPNAPTDDAVEAAAEAP